jgi:hypothetical protein
MRDSSEFVARLRTLAENFARARNIPSTVIRVWTPQDAYDVAAAGAGPLDGFLDDPDDMVAGTDGAALTPRQVILPIGAITRIELLAERPREHAIGFAAEVDPTAAP